MPVLPLVGDLFGRYRIDAEIGRGGMGVVYGATDTAIGRTVALKVVGAGLGESDEFRLRFEREAAVLARLDSPHVIAIYDYGTHDDCPYIATQYVGGGDLGELLAARGPMPAALALRVCAQVADALHDAHRVGVVHRDVKPTNVLLRDADTVDLHAYLCDFGIARTATDGLTSPGAVAGTWSYLSPECGRGAPGSPASDIYALGCLLWATLTGAPPYRGSDVGIAVAHQREPVPQLGHADELSQRIDHILRRSLAKDPAQRYPTADQARVDLLAAAGLTDSGVHAVVVPPDQRPTQARQVALGSLPPRLSPPTPPPTGRRRRAALVIAAVCAAVVAVAGVAAAVSLLGDDPTRPTTDPTPTSPPTVSSPTTPDPTGEPTGPTRVDDGGPITGDLDGDGFGDLGVEFYHTVTRGESNDTFTDVTTWRSDGERLVQGKTRRQADAPGDRSDQDVVGDFDGDGLLETAEVQQEGPRLRVVGDLSGGTRLDREVTKKKRYAFIAVTDLDADGADDLVLQYYVDYEVSPVRFAGVLLGDASSGAARALLEVPYSQSQASFEVGDFDGDGYGDVAVIRHRTPGLAPYPHDLTLWLGDGKGTQRGPRLTFPATFRPEFLSADVDGDEADELVMVDESLNGTLSIFDLRDGRIVGPSGAGALRAAGKEAPSYGVADLDGDGRDDIVSVSTTRGRRADLMVARSDGRRLVASRWATWRRNFDTSKYYSSLTFITRSFS